jgi:hypothetical protein
MFSALQVFGGNFQESGNDLTSAFAAMSFTAGEVNRYVKNPESKPILEGPVLRRPAYLQGIRVVNYVFSCLPDGPKDFRLLKLWPSTSPDTECVRCDLIPCRIDEMKGKYDTLSYSWGSQRQDFPVLISDGKDDTTPTRAVRVTPHLYDALLRLRDTDQPVLLWIDQICIDQTSNEEKNAQVARMADIYRSARKSVVWLGSCRGDDKVLLVELFSKLADTTFTSISDDAGHLEGLLPVTTVGNPSTRARQRHNAFVRLLSRPWFTRAWIFQEAVASPEVSLRLGPLSFPLDVLIRLADTICAEEVRIGGYSKSLIMSTVGFDALSLIKHERGCGITGCPRDGMFRDNFLALLMQALHQFQATNPRDYIYAFLAFQPEDATVKIRPDYALPPAAAWTEAAKSLIRQTESLDIFSAARADLTIAGDGGKGFGGGMPSSNDLPTWVPYWSEPFPYARPIYCPDFQTSFDACRGIPHEWVKGKQDGQLVVHGVEISSVVWISPHNFAGTYYRTSPNGTKGVLNLDMHIASAERHFHFRPDDVGKRFKERYPDPRVSMMRTLLADGAFGSQIPLSDAEVDELTDLVENEGAIQEAYDDIRAKPATESKEQRQKYQRLERLREQALIVQQKKVFVTASGHLGLASKCVKAGDLVYVLQGSRTPCLLRGSGMFKLIGQCYVEGIMYGEAFHDELKRVVII